VAASAAAAGYPATVSLHDREIAAADRCETCDGQGWKWFDPPAESGQESRWIVCRECFGTGRKDKKGRKRHRPDENAAG